MLTSCIWIIEAKYSNVRNILRLNLYFYFLKSICTFKKQLYFQQPHKRVTKPHNDNALSCKTPEQSLAMAKTAAESNPKPRPINNQEETTLRNCFPWNVYYLQNIDYRPQAIFCRGKLKTIPEDAYQEIKSNIEQAFGDRFFLIFQESFRGKPFFALVPNPNAKKKEKVESDLRIGFAIAMFAITLLTTTVAGITIDGTLLEELPSNFSLLFKGLSYSLPLLFIIAVQKFSHYFVAVYYKIRTTLPYFIPFPFLLDNFSVGTLGALSQRKSPIPHRKALFDLAMVSCLSGLLIIIPILVWGLSLSEAVPIEEYSTFNLQAQDPRLSLFFSLLAKLALGSALTTNTGIQLHPIAVAGCVGLFIAAINLMPIGQLDGGHIIHAVYGQKMAIAVGQITRILALLFALVHPYFWIWTIIMWLIPLIDQPALNDVTELDNKRDFLGLFALALLVIIILPLPSAIAGLLGI